MNENIRRSITITIPNDLVSKMDFFLSDDAPHLTRSSYITYLIFKDLKERGKVKTLDYKGV